MSLWLAACASEVSSEEIERALHQPYDDEPQVAVTQQALGAVQTIALACDAQCGSSLAMGSSSDAAVVTQPGGDIIKRVIISSGQTASVDTNHLISSITEASDSTVYYSHIPAGANHRVVRVTGSSLTWLFDGVGTVRNLMVDSTNLYYVDDGGLRKRPRAGGAGQTLVSAADVGTLLGIDGTKLYFTNKARSQLRRIDNDGTNNKLIQSGSVAGFAQDSSSLYNLVNPYLYVIRQGDVRTTAVLRTRERSVRHRREGWRRVLPREG